MGKKTRGFCGQTVDRGAGGDVEQTVFFVAPGQVCWLLRHFRWSPGDCLASPTPKISRAGYKINFLRDPLLFRLRHAVVLRAGFLSAEVFAVADRTIRRDVVDADIPLFAVIDIHALSGRERKPVHWAGSGLWSGGEHCLLHPDDIHPGTESPVSRRPPDQGFIGKVVCPIRTDHYVVGTVEFLSLGGGRPVLCICRPE